MYIEHDMLNALIKPIFNNNDAMSSPRPRARLYVCHKLVYQDSFVAYKRTPSKFICNVKL